MELWFSYLEFFYQFLVCDWSLSIFSLIDNNIFSFNFSHIAVFVHASLRLRNLRNKLSNKMEKIGLKKLTPMGVILDSLGIEAELLE